MEEGKKKKNARPFFLSLSLDAKKKRGYPTGGLFHK